MIDLSCWNCGVEFEAPERHKYLPKAKRLCSYCGTHEEDEEDFLSKEDMYYKPEKYDLVDIFENPII